jgi:hypothetical protein
MFKQSLHHSPHTRRTFLYELLPPARFFFTLLVVVLPHCTSKESPMQRMFAMGQKAVILKTWSISPSTHRAR